MEWISRGCLRFHWMSAEPCLLDVKTDDVHGIFPPEGSLLRPLHFKQLVSIVPYNLYKCYTGFTASIQGTAPQWYRAHALHFQYAETVQSEMQKMLMYY